MFKELVENNRFCFHEEFDTWQDAIKASVMPLIKENIATDEYVDAIIESVNKNGPYIVIAPNICIPHAQEGKGVNDTAISFMKTEKPVKFSDSEEHDAQLFFVLASTNNEKHLKNLTSLVTFLEDENNISLLLKSKNKSDLEKLIQR